MISEDFFFGIVGFFTIFERLLALEGHITVLWRSYYCPLEVILLSFGGHITVHRRPFFGPEMLPEATENFF